jgi:hypothetical protein
MRRTIILVSLVLAAGLLLSGCMTQFATQNGKLAYAEIAGTPVGTLDVEEGFLYIIHPDLITFGDKGWETIDNDIEPVLAATGGNAVRDLRLSFGYTTMDFILTAVVPVVSWGTYTLEGEVVRR